MPARPPIVLQGRVEADIAIVGGGFTGLWTALALTDTDPALRVVLCEAETVGAGASGRNGGFCDPSLTHGLANGVRHFPDELEELERLGAESYRALVAFLETHGIACDLERTGTLDVAVEPWQVDELAEQAALYRRHGQPVEIHDAAAVRERLDSPRFLAGLERPHGGALLNPAKLADGLRRVAEARGVAVFERSPVSAVRPRGRGVTLVLPGGVVLADRAVLATNAYSGRVLRSTRRHYVPVYDYILVSEPLSAEQLGRIGWKGRQGVSDSGNQFHYFRLTADDRILWGGFDAVYYPRNGIGPRYDDRPATYALLEQHFRATFPQLAELRFPHRWGGAIATTTRFTPVFGSALGGRVVYALGYTGLGVAATRFAAQVLAAKLIDPGSPLLRLRYTTRAPFPFPPEPLRSLAVTLVRRALQRADRREGRRGPLLAALDRFGIGFDS